MKKTFLLTIFLTANILLFAQDSTQTSRNFHTFEKNQKGTQFLLTGGAFFDFSAKENNHNTFGGTGFSPIFLWKMGRLFFESEVEMEFEDGELGIDVEYAKFSYMLNKYMTIGAGRMLTPFGAYLERLHPAFVEKFPNAPMGMHHMDGMPAIGPNGAEMGVDVRGGIPLGSTKINYAFYVSNGPMLETKGMMAGSLEYENFNDNNSNKAIGGRVGLLPFSNSSFEIGLSANYSKPGNSDSLYKSLTALAYAVDFSFVKNIVPLKGIINIKAQLNALQVDKSDYENVMDTTGMKYSFDNKNQAYYVMLSYRPALLQNNFIKNLEIAGRYSSVSYAKDANWGGTTTRTDIGLNYWFSWRSALKFAYEMQTNPDKKTENTFLIRFSTGF